MNLEARKCPSCGASPKNKLNCEYCGSLFVRFEELGLDTEDILEPNPGLDPKKSFGSFGGFAFNGLQEALSKNLSLQTEHKGFMVTNVCIKDETADQKKQGFLKKLFSPIDPDTIIQVVQANGLQDATGQNKKMSFPGIAIHLPFIKTNGDWFNESPDGQVPLSSFEQMEESVLFTSVEEDQDLLSKTLDFGNDSTGAAYLVSKLLIEFFGVSKTAQINAPTEDYDP